MIPEAIALSECLASQFLSLLFSDLLPRSCLKLVPSLHPREINASQVLPVLLQLSYVPSFVPTPSPPMTPPAWKAFLPELSLISCWQMEREALWSLPSNHKASERSKVEGRIARRSAKVHLQQTVLGGGSSCSPNSEALSTHSGL